MNPQTICTFFIRIFSERVSKFEICTFRSVFCRQLSYEIISMNCLVFCLYACMSKWVVFVSMVVWFVFVVCFFNFCKTAYTYQNHALKNSSALPENHVIPPKKSSPSPHHAVSVSVNDLPVKCLHKICLPSSGANRDQSYQSLRKMREHWASGYRL